MEIYAVILFAVGIILGLIILPGTVKDYQDEKWMDEMSERILPAVREEVERENLGNSIKVKE